MLPQSARRNSRWTGPEGKWGWGQWGEKPEARSQNCQSCGSRFPFWLLASFPANLLILLQIHRKLRICFFDEHNVLKTLPGCERAVKLTVTGDGPDAHCNKSDACDEL